MRHQSVSFGSYRREDLLDQERLCESHVLENHRTNAKAKLPRPRGEKRLHWHKGRILLGRDRDGRHLLH